jgi:hypothetical protein
VKEEDVSCRGWRGIDEGVKDRKNPGEERVVNSRRGVRCDEFGGGV